MSAEFDLAYQESRSFRLQQHQVSIDGGHPIDFRRYHYVTEIIDEDCLRISILKGGQMGFTIACILKALEQAREGTRRGIGYYFPGLSEAQDFSKARFSPLMDHNPDVWPQLSTDADAAGLRQIGQTYLYFRGIGQIGRTAASTSALKSVPLDVEFLDEVDEMDPSRVDTVLHRLDASLDPQVIELSTPTFPGSYIDEAYKASDQRVWEWRCGKCGEWTCLETTFPDCIVELTGRDPYFKCAHCEETLDRVRGRWVAQRPEVKNHRGYWISQLSSPTKTALDIVKAAEQAEESGRRREYYNHVLAQPYADVDDEIAESELVACLRNEPRSIRHEGPAALGCDPGKVHHYEIRVRMNDKDTVQIARGVADSYSELAELVRRYNVESGVIDVGFDPTAVMEFVRAHPGFWGCRYVSGKISSPDWNHKERIVTVGRDWLLDRVHQDVLERRVSLHQKDEWWPEYVKQMGNLKRSVTEHPQSGLRKARWVVMNNKNDHMHHASGYCALACDRVSLAKSVQRAHGARRRKQSQRRSAMTL